MFTTTDTLPHSKNGSWMAFAGRFKPVLESRALLTKTKIVISLSFSLLSLPTWLPAPASTPTSAPAPAPASAPASLNLMQFKETSHLIQH